MNSSTEFLFDVDKLVSVDTGEDYRVQIAADYAKKKAAIEATVQAQRQHADDKEVEFRRKLQGHINALALLEALEEVKRFRANIENNHVQSLADLDRRRSVVLRHLDASTSSLDEEAGARPTTGDNGEQHEVDDDETLRREGDDEGVDRDELESARVRDSEIDDDEGQENAVDQVDDISPVVSLQIE